MRQLDIGTHLRAHGFSGGEGTSEASYSVYKRLGFQEYYKIAIYTWNLNDFHRRSQARLNDASQKKIVSPGSRSKRIISVGVARSSVVIVVTEKPASAMRSRTSGP